MKTHLSNQNKFILKSIRYDSNDQLGMKESIFFPLPMILLVIVLLLSTSIFAQKEVNSNDHLTKKDIEQIKSNNNLIQKQIDAYEPELIKKMDKAQYIFEGVITDVQYFIDSSALPEIKIYSTRTIEICKIFRGSNKIQYGTIQVLSVGGEYQRKKGGMIEVHGEGYPKKSFIDKRGIYFCATSKYPTSPYLSKNIEQLYAPYGIGVGFSEKSFGNPPQWTTIGLKRNFDHQSEMYAFMEQFDNIKIPHQDNCIFDEKNNIPHKQEVKAPSTTLSEEERRKNSDELINKRLKLIESDKKKGNKKKSSGEVLNVSFANSSLTGTNPNGSRFIEFDIVVSTNQDDSTFFSNIVIDFDYNNAAFGNSIFPTTAIITRGVEFDTPSYVDPNTFAHNTKPSSLRIPFGININNPSLNNTAITTEPKVLLHFKFEVASCAGSADITFQDSIVNQLLSKFTTTPDGGELEEITFKTTNYQAPIAKDVCNPLVLEFTDTLPAGAGLTMTIIGENFGSEKGIKGKIIFKDANKGKPTDPTTNILFGLNDYDYVSWSDKKIVLTLPSHVEVDAAIWPESLNAKIGSGTWEVVNYWGDKVQVSQPIYIPFNVGTYEQTMLDGSLKKIPTNLISNVRDEYLEFFLDKHIDTIAGMRNVIEQVLCDFTEKTGVKMVISGTVDTTDLRDRNNMSVISLATFSDINISPSKTLVTNQHLSICPANPTLNREPWVSSKEVDILINAFPSLPRSFELRGGNIPIGFSDFYKSFIHEIAHGVGLKHSNNNFTVMWPYSIHGQIPANLRTNFNTDLSSQVGIRYIIGKSSGSNFTDGCGSVKIIDHFGESCVVGIRKNERRFNLGVFPNPTSSILNLELNTTEDVMIEIYDLIGKKIFSDILMKENTAYQLNTESFSTGTYILRVISKNINTATKFIKQ